VTTKASFQVKCSAARTVLAKEQPEHHPPRDDCVEQALHTLLLPAHREMPNYSQPCANFCGLVGLCVSSQQVAVEHSFALLEPPHVGFQWGKRPVFMGVLNAKTADHEISPYSLRKYLIFDLFPTPSKSPYGFERFSRRDIYDVMINRRQSYSRRCSHQIQMISNRGTSRSFSKS